jgi:hypothetical protein
MAALLSSMVLVFVTCHSLKAGLNIYEAYMVSSSKCSQALLHQYKPLK